MKETLEVTIRRGDHVFRIPSTDVTVDINVQSAPLVDFLDKPYPDFAHYQAAEPTRRVSFHIQGTSSRMDTFFGKRDPWWRRLRTRIKAAIAEARA